MNTHFSHICEEKLEAKRKESREQNMLKVDKFCFRKEGLLTRDVIGCLRMLMKWWTMKEWSTEIICLPHWLEKVCDRVNWDITLMILNKMRLKR